MGPRAEQYGDQLPQAQPQILPPQDRDIEGDRSVKAVHQTGQKRFVFFLAAKLRVYRAWRQGSGARFARHLLLCGFAIQRPCNLFISKHVLQLLCFLLLGLCDPSTSALLVGLSCCVRVDTFYPLLSAVFARNIEVRSDTFGSP